MKIRGKNITNMASCTNKAKIMAGNKNNNFL
jgi:hypothetical protein